MAVSFGKVDITPAVGAALAGYAVDKPRLAQGVRSPLWARCLIFWDNGSPNVVVSAVGLPVLFYHGVEEPMIRLGKKLVDRIPARREVRVAAVA